MDEIRQYFEELYRTVKPALLAYFRAQPALAGSAEDLIQETFRRALRNPGPVRAAPSPRAYLFGIARHAGIDALRRRRPSEELADLPAAQPPAEDPRLDRMRTAIAALPALQRELLELKLRHDLTYEEVAEVLQVPVGTVRSRLHYAIARLQQVLKHDSPPASPL